LGCALRGREVLGPEGPDIDFRRKITTILKTKAEKK